MHCFSISLNGHQTGQSQLLPTPLSVGRSTGVALYCLLAYLLTARRAFERRQAGGGCGEVAGGGEELGVGVEVGSYSLASN